MTCRVIALVDHPSPRSMGMLGVMIQQPSGVRTISGLVGHEDRLVSDAEFERLQDEGHILPVDDAAIPAFASDATVAFWIGDAFAEQAQRLCVPFPMPPKQGTITLKGQGQFWFDRHPEVYDATQDWLWSALRRVHETGSHDLARLMTRVAPDDELTRAALWHSAHSESQRESELRWFCRIDHDNGIDSTDESLQERFRELGQEVMMPQMEVVAVLGKMYSRSKKVAWAFAKAMDLPFKAFGDWFREEARRQQKSDTTESLQDLGHQVLETRSPSMLLRAVFSEQVARPLRLVIDGIRHTRVLEAVKQLRGSPRIKTLGVEVDEAARQQRVRVDPQIKDPERALHHETEAEMDHLIDHADTRLSL